MTRLRQTQPDSSLYYYPELSKGKHANYKHMFLSLQSKMKVAMENISNTYNYSRYSDESQQLLNKILKF